MRKRKNFYLDEIKLKKAQKILGTETATKTIDLALDLVAFRKELLGSLKKVKGRGGVERLW